MAKKTLIKNLGSYTLKAFTEQKKASQIKQTNISSTANVKSNIIGINRDTRIGGGFLQSSAGGKYTVSSVVAFTDIQGVAQFKKGLSFFDINSITSIGNTHYYSTLIVGSSGVWINNPTVKIDFLGSFTAINGKFYISTTGDFGVNANAAGVVFNNNGISGFNSNGTNTFYVNNKGDTFLTGAMRFYRYDYNGAPQSVWIITHNLGTCNIIAQGYQVSAGGSTGGALLSAGSPIVDNANQIRLQFSGGAISGYAVLSYYKPS